MDEDYISYPEVHYFHHELNECEQSLLEALNELDSSQRCVKELESSIKGSLRGVEWAREYYYEMAEELNRDQERFEYLYWDTEKELEKVRSELWAAQAELRDLKKKPASGWNVWIIWSVRVLAGPDWFNRPGRGRLRRRFFFAGGAGAVHPRRRALHI